jgi:hypothetical protein
MSARHARPAPVGFSLTRLSAAARLVGALAISGVLWLAVVAVTG